MIWWQNNQWLLHIQVMADKLCFLFISMRPIQKGPLMHFGCKCINSTWKRNIYLLRIKSLLTMIYLFCASYNKIFSNVVLLLFSLVLLMQILLYFLTLEIHSVSQGKGPVHVYNMMNCCGVSFCNFRTRFYASTHIPVSLLNKLFIIDIIIFSNDYLHICVVIKCGNM